MFPLLILPPYSNGGKAMTTAFICRKRRLKISVTSNAFFARCRAIGSGIGLGREMRLSASK